MHLSVCCISIYPSVCLSFSCLNRCLSVCQTVLLSAGLSVFCPCYCPSVCQCIRLYVVRLSASVLTVILSVSFLSVSLFCIPKPCLSNCLSTIYHTMVMKSRNYTAHLTWQFFPPLTSHVYQSNFSFCEIFILVNFFFFFTISARTQDFPRLRLFGKRNTKRQQLSISYSNITVFNESFLYPINSFRLLYSMFEQN